MSHKRCRQGVLLLLAVLCWAASAPVFAQTRPDPGGSEQARALYARHLGDGLRHHAEGRFDEAVEHLFRAYALEPEARTLGLIIASYDQMGFCDAANRQVELFSREHGGSQPPELDRCARAGEVAIECNEPGMTVRVNGRFDARCGETIALPAGEHRLSAARLPAAQNVRVQPDEPARVELQFRAGPRETGPTVAKLSEETPAVERLNGAASDYASFQDHDGLYRIFILPGSVGTGAVLPLGRPEVLRLCDSGERFDRERRRCVPADGLQIKKME